MSDGKRGVLLGTAVGDCLGAAVEGVAGRLKGLHTDATQQSWIVWGALGVGSLVDLNRIARLYVSFDRARPGLLHGVHRGVGRNFRETLSKLGQGTPPLEAGCPSAGNGAAMRIPPVGAYYAGHPERIVDTALQVSLITHTDPRALEAAAALAVLVGAMTGSKPPATPGEGLTAAIDGARLAEEKLGQGKPVRLPPAALAHSGAFRRVLSAMRNRLGDEPRSMLAEIGKLASAETPERKSIQGTDGFAPASVTAAICVGLTAPGFREALETLLHAGGDVDTCGAMTGAVAGARFGASGIPAKWIKALVGREALEAIATAMAGGTAQLINQEDLEEEWTRLEADAALKE